MTSAEGDSLEGRLWVKKRVDATFSFFSAWFSCSWCQREKLKHVSVRTKRERERESQCEIV